MNCFSCGKECKDSVCVNPDCQWSHITDDNIFRERIATLRALLRESVEDGERLAEKYTEYGETYVECRYCGHNLKYKDIHYPDCPITLHAALMAKLED
jgi:hypothetical protein